MKSFARNSVFLSAGALALAFAAAESAAFAATPITRCSLLASPGSYVLANDIINPPMRATGGVCIQATVDRVTLDLAGHTVHASAQTGTAISGLNSFVVRNGTIEGFALAVGGTSHATVENLVIDGASSTGIAVVDGRVEGNTVVNTTEGISTAGPSIINGNFMKDVQFGVVFGADSIVRDNVIVSGTIGIQSGNGEADKGLIENNTVKGQSFHSLFLNQCQSTLVDGNLFNNNSILGQFDATCQVVDTAFAF
jgi:hypothetical protein